MIRFLLLLSLCLSARAADFTIAPPSDWVEPEEVPTFFVVPQEEIAGGVYYLLVDRQVELQDARERFSHSAWMIVDSAGLDDYSSFSLEFHPSYQTLTLHTARLIRDGEVIDQLDRSRISLLQREEELESLILDGGWTLNFQFSDVRVGDTVEYSYTLRGDNPATAGHSAGAEQFGWSVPVARRVVRLTWPRERAIQTRVLASNEEPQDHSTEARMDLRWIGEMQPALIEESGVPYWHLEMPWVQYSDYPTWDAVLDWARPIYALPQVDSAVAALADEIRQRHPNDKARQVMDALDFIQEEVRYLGIEIGERSLVPSPPGRTLEQRFGDCKDKTQLLVSILDELDITARPVLAHTSNGKAIEDMLPSPFAFNHMIAAVELNATTYLLDPTMTQQAGLLDHVVQPDYGPVLVIDEGPARFIDSERNHRAGEVQILERFAPLPDQAADYTIETRYTASWADAIRRDFAQKSRQEISQNYTNYTAGFYPNPSLVEPIEVSDDTLANVLTVKEHYRIEPLWLPSSEDERLEADFQAWQVNNYLSSVDQVERKHPLARSHPVSVRQTVRIELQGDWDLSDEDHEIVDEQFRLKRSVRFRDQLLTLDYDYQSQADHVPSGRINEFASHVDQARDLLFYGLYQWPETESGPVGDDDWSVFLDAYSPRELGQFFVFALFIGLAPLGLWAMGRTHRGASVWLGMLTAPGRVFDQVRDREGTVIMLAVLAGVTTAISNLALTDSHQQMGAVGLVVAILLAGIFGGLLNLYLASGIWHLGARMLRGQGDFRATRDAYAWAGLPYILFGAVLIAVAVGTWPELFTADGPVPGEDWLSLALYLGFLLQTVVFGGWFLANAVAAVATAQQFGLARSFFSLMLGLTVVIGSLIALVLGLGMLLEAADG